MPSGSRMSQNIRALSPLTPALEREDLERGRVGHGDHVRLVDPGEALDRRAVEADALLEGGLQLGRRHRDALQRAEHVGEPQPDKTDVPLLQRTEHELLLTVHVYPSRRRAPAAVWLVPTLTRQVFRRTHVRTTLTGPAASATRSRATGESGTADDRCRVRTVHAGQDEGMPTLRLALAQVNPTVGDLAGNAALVRQWTRRAADAGAQLVAFPEMMLTGYPVEDLVFRESFVAASRARAATGSPPTSPRTGSATCPSSSATSTPTGRPAPAPTPRRAGGRATRWPCCTAAAVVATLLQAPPAQLRRLRRGPLLRARRHAEVVRIGGVDVALTICEDLWQAGGPFAAAGRAGVGLVVNINGSPYELNKDDVRLPLVRRRAAEAGATVAYVNMVGGQDELVFDGDSMVVARGRRRCSPGRRSSPSTCWCIDLDLPAAATAAAGRRCATRRDADRADVHRLATSRPARRPVRAVARRSPTAVADEAEVWQALVLGLRDYVRKNGFRSVVLGLSGGIDSAVVAAIAVDALGAATGGRRVHAQPALLRALQATTRPTWPSAPAWTTGSSRSSRWWTPSWPTCRCPASRWRTCRPGSAASSSWRCPTRRATWCSPPATRASWRSATPLCTATRSAASTRSRTCRRRMVWRLARWRNAEAARRGRAAADPGELHQQAAERRAAPGPARHRLAARLRRARRDPRRATSTATSAGTA